MNSVSLIGTLVEDPDLRERVDEPVRCTMRLAVSRRDDRGQQLPGVVYVEIATFGLKARDCAERLRRGDRLGLTGRLERDEYRAESGEWLVEYAVLADQLDFPSKRPSP
jgi:single-stranded DNA-binding protein